jgi:hypothetical protein
MFCSIIFSADVPNSASMCATASGHGIAPAVVVIPDGAGLTPGGISANDDLLVTHGMAAERDTLRSG